MSPAREIPTLKPVLTIGPATAQAVHDGDTLRFGLPMAALLPGAVTWSEIVRVAHVNAPELRTPEGRAAAEAVRSWAILHPRGTLLVYGREKYGRLLADYQPDGGELLSAFVKGLAGTVPMDLVSQVLGR